MKFKKIIIWIVVILLIFCIALIGKVAINHYYVGLDKNNVMSREQFISLLEKGKEYPNYYYSSSNNAGKNELKTEIYIKDGIRKTVINGKTHIWENYNEDEIITILPELNGKKYVVVNKISEFYKDHISTDQAGYDYSLVVNDDIYEFEYMGIKQEDGKNTVFVKVWNKEKDKLKLTPTIFCVDLETGLIMKRIDYLFFGYKKIEGNRNVKIDIVTDEDVIKPNLEEYEILK